MCIVIDINTLASVFNESSAEHQNFKPVFDWIMNGNRAVIVYGGSKYRKELERAGKYRKLFIELRNAGKTCEIDSQVVDDK